jgi:hypothetical protein
MQVQNLPSYIQERRGSNGDGHQLRFHLILDFVPSFRTAKLNGDQLA